MLVIFKRAIALYKAIVVLVASGDERKSEPLATSDKIQAANTSGDVICVYDTA